MGGVLCSYFGENKAKSALLHAITTSNTNEIKRIMTASKETNSSSFKSPLKYVKQICYYSQEVEDGCGAELLNAQIDDNGNTPLTLSIETGQVESFKFLLIQLNADPNTCNYITGYSPLHMLAKTKCQANLNFKSNRTSSQKSTSNAVLVSQPSPQTTNKIAQTSESKSNETQVRGSSTLSEESLREMVYLLADKGAELNKTIQMDISSDSDQMSHLYFNALMLAVYSLNFIVVEELLNLGCDCNFQEKSANISALHLACYMANYELVNLILDDEMRFIKVSLELKSANGCHCLHWLAMSRSYDVDIGIFKLFTNYIMKKYSMSNTPSPISSTSSTEMSSELEKNLYLNGLDEAIKNFLDQTNNEMQTPLMIASLNNKQHLVRKILIIFMLFSFSELFLQKVGI